MDEFNEQLMEETYEPNYQNHYIRLDGNDNIIRGFSDAFEPPQPDDICINEQGGRHFRLFLNGEENPRLMNDYGIYLYQYIDGAVIAKTPQAIQAEIDALPPVHIPTVEERLGAMEEIFIELAVQVPEIETALRSSGTLEIVSRYEEKQEAIRQKELEKEIVSKREN